jgi:DNA mismatch repair protein MutL
VAGEVPWDDHGPFPQAAGVADLDDASEASPRGKAMQLHDRYLVVETVEGMEVIDQHALHERVLYERLRTRVLDGPLESQRLLVPEPVDLAPAEAAAVLESRELLARLGIEAQPFGGDTVLVASFPTLLGGKSSPADVLRDVAARLVGAEGPTGAGGGPEARELCDHLLATMACKAAVKYGDPLSPEEVEALLAQRPGVENHHHCPHGRPTSLIFTREELDRRFGRT